MLVQRQVLFGGNSIGYQMHDYEQRGPGEVLRCPADPSVAQQDESCWRQPPGKGAATEGGRGTAVHSKCCKEPPALTAMTGGGRCGAEYTDIISNFKVYILHHEPAL